MQPQPNAEIIESPIFTMWLDELGILCFLSKKHPPQTREVSEKLFADIRKISQGQKRCMLMDLTNFQLPTKESLGLWSNRNSENGNCNRLLIPFSTRSYCRKYFLHNKTTTLPDKNVYQRTRSKRMAKTVFIKLFFFVDCKFLGGKTTP